MNQRILGYIFALPIFFASVSNAETLYVKTTGDDSKDCLSWSSACKTIGQAVALASDTGSVINIAEGIYKPTATITLKDKLQLIGGYKTDTNAYNPDKYRTIISGDTDNNDVVTDGVTMDYSDISGANLSRLFWAQDITEVVLKGFTLTGMQQTGNHGSAMWIQASEVSFEDVDFIGNYAFSLGTVLIYGVDVFAQGTFTSCSFIGNYAGTGGALNPHRHGHAVIKNSEFRNNDAGSTGGAIYVNNGLSSLQLENATFEGNTAPEGGAVALAAGVDSSTIVNATFINNNATTGVGGALRIQGSGHEVGFSTFYGNAAVSAGGAIQNDSGALNSIYSSLLLGNTAASNGNVNAVAGELSDGGYNLIGSAGISEAAFNFGSSSFTSPHNMLDLIEVDSFENGGLLKSVRISEKVDAGYPRDVIQNDGIPFFGVGQSADYPFRSLADAHGAIKSSVDYGAGIYYFDLGASYGSAPDYTVSLSGQSFSTYVDDEGYVLIASAGVAGDVLSIVTETSALTLRSDSKLPASILAALGEDENTVVDKDQWVRASSLCNGSKTLSDVRGLPRSDFVNPADADQQGLISNCDIGAFEFNNGYRYDCYSEDGERPGVVVDGGLASGEASANANICFGGDIFNATPAALLDNIGSVNTLWLSLAAIIFGWRQRKYLFA